jgi:class 3 adenylate cyclase
MDTRPSSGPTFRKLLDDVQGRSEFVIAVIIDVRGFSSFAMKVESVQTTAFLKRIYIEMIDRYFGNASFIKPTGDGLLLAFPYDETNVKEVASYVVKSSLACLTDFAKLCDDDDMINFNIPDKVGIGICRGAATNVVSHGSTIDYSGRPFNIASRLMDLARPTGIILDSNFGENLIPSDIKDKFSTAHVYLRGITDNALTKIYYSKDTTVIPSEKTEMPRPIT